MNLRWETCINSSHLKLLDRERKLNFWIPTHTRKCLWGFHKCLEDGSEEQIWDVSISRGKGYRKESNIRNTHIKSMLGGEMSYVKLSFILNHI